MARETKAQREARLELETSQRVFVAKATYVERMMALLARATKENFELRVLDDEFVVSNRDDSRATPYFVKPVWSEVADVNLFELEMSVEFKEEERAESERRYQVKQNALAKLTKEERELLNLQ